MSVAKKKNWYGYVDYFYPRAKWLEENCLIGDLEYTSPEADVHVDDPLMQHNPNYNCVSRTQEGFMNVLEDLWHKENSLQYRHRTDEIKSRISNYKTDSWDEQMWVWSFIAHRATGSGFSGEEDHGYRNSIVSYFGECNSLEDMVAIKDNWLDNKRPMFSSKGNIPPFPKPGISIFDTLIKYQYDHSAKILEWLKSQDVAPSVMKTTDYMNQLNLDEGIKRWNFPFSMAAADIATYFPNMVDPNSDLYCGRNAMISIQDMYEKPKGWNINRLCSYGLAELTEVLGTSALAHEDTLCIYKRFLEGVSRNGDYVSKGGYTLEGTYK